MDRVHSNSCEHAPPKLSCSHAASISPCGPRSPVSSDLGPRTPRARSDTLACPPSQTQFHPSSPHLVFELTPESNITILAFLVSRHAVATMHRTFPSVRVVTAALDTGLSELKISFQSLATPGEGLSEGDFAARLVRSEHIEDISGPRRSGERRREGQEVEKVAWVVTPGMGHIG